MDGVASSVSDLIEHQSDYHEGFALSYFQCDLCDFYSDQRNKTKEHLKTEHNIDEYNPYKCRQCTFKVFNYAELSRHLSLHITELKVF